MAPPSFSAEGIKGLQHLGRQPHYGHSPPASQRGVALPALWWCSGNRASPSNKSLHPAPPHRGQAIQDHEILKEWRGGGGAPWHPTMPILVQTGHGGAKEAGVSTATRGGERHSQIPLLLKRTVVCWGTVSGNVFLTAWIPLFYISWRSGRIGKLAKLGF